MSVQPRVISRLSYKWWPKVRGAMGSSKKRSTASCGSKYISWHENNSFNSVTIEVYLALTCHYINENLQLCTAVYICVGSAILSLKSNCRQLLVKKSCNQIPRLTFFRHKARNIGQYFRFSATAKEKLAHVRQQMWRPTVNLINEVPTRTYEMLS